VTPIAAETLGLRALAWLVAKPEALEKFLGISGLDGPDLRARASEPEMLAAVLDYILMSEPLVVEFCESEGVAARELHSARRVLVGADE
jgi:hypothetical protein